MTEILVGAAATIIAASIGAIAALVRANQLNRREIESTLKEYRQALAQSQRREHLAYLWNRQLVDHIYRGLKPPPPAPPPGLLDD